MAISPHSGFLTGSIQNTITGYAAVSSAYVANSVMNGTPAFGTIEASDVKLDGVSIKESISKINERLAILEPDFVLMEKYTALKELYDQYKTLEALCREQKP